MKSQVQEDQKLQAWVQAVLKFHISRGKCKNQNNNNKKKSICPCQKSIMWSEKHMENKRLCIINYKIAFSHLRANTSVFFLNPDISNG